jgi:hypothetical protein
MPTLQKVTAVTAVVPTHPTPRLRFVKRADGKLILQQLDGVLGWGDVPTVEITAGASRVTVRGPVTLVEEEDSPGDPGKGGKKP